MARHLDHIVLCGRDLAALHAAYDSFGFTLTPRAVHPFGTHNHLAQLQGNFLELLAIDDPLRISAAAAGQFSFGAAARDYIGNRHHGLMMTVLASRDADADIAAFRAGGLDTYERLDFGRDAVLPDGSSVRVGFSLAFVTHPDMPEATFFCCQQRHPPELFWKPQYQKHANTARRLTEVVMVAADPSPVAAHVAAVLDASSATVDGGFVIGAPDDRISILQPSALAERYPELAGIDASTPRFVAYRVTVADPDVARSVLAGNGVPYRSTADGAVIAPARALGVAIDLFAG